MINLLKLSPREVKLLSFVKDYLKNCQLRTTARIAGGWVRDKILGKESTDIDIALDDITGVEFANGINKYMKASGISQSFVAVIQANPDQSKHLETATMKIFDFDIDFVNLRVESYAESSRIPSATFGTPLEDALRRDFTINSLFYNINKDEIEDFTGHGLTDLNQKLIRTPLPALTTFMDDPLRVLRAVRFSCRLGFRLDPDIIQAARSPSIGSALALKVSKERVLKELMLMIGAKGHPAHAFLAFQRLGLLKSIVSLESAISGAVDLPIVNEEFQHSWQKFSTETALFATILLAKYPSVCREAPDANFDALVQDSLDIVHISQDEFEVTRGYEQWVKLYTACMYAGLTQYSFKNKKGKTIALFLHLMKDVLKVDNDTVKGVCAILENVATIQRLSKSHMEPMTSLHSGQFSFDWNFQRSEAEIEAMREEAGMLIRECKEYWIMAVVVSCAIECSVTRRDIPVSIFSLWNPIDRFCDVSTDDVMHLSSLSIVDQVELREIFHRYLGLLRLWAVEWNLSKSYELKPLLDGFVVGQLFPSIKGTAFREVMDQQIRWLLQKPSLDKNDVEQLMKSKYQK